MHSAVQNTLFYHYNYFICYQLNFITFGRQTASNVLFSQNSHKARVPKIIKTCWR